MRDGALLAEYVETESGKRTDRPELARALRHAKAANATLVCAKLDRIGRRASHVLSLLDGAGVPVIFADNPTANDLTLGVLAVVAQEEGRAISARTRAALEACRARGVKLGNPHGARALRAYEATHGNGAGCEGASRAADDFAARLRFAAEQAIANGSDTLAGIAEALNAQGFPSRRGGRWHPSNVSLLLARLHLALRGPENVR